MDYEFVPGRDDFPPDEIAMLRQQLAAVAKERDEIAAQARMLDRAVEERNDQLAAKQAQIDALMLEYCPNEMTKEQLDEWARNQRPETCGGKVMDISVENGKYRYVLERK